MLLLMVMLLLLVIVELLGHIVSSVLWLGVLAMADEGARILHALERGLL